MRAVRAPIAGPTLSITELYFVTGETAYVDDTGIEDQVLTLNPHQRAFHQRCLVEVEGRHFLRIFNYRLFDEFGVESSENTDGKKTESRFQLLDLFGTGLYEFLAFPLQIQ